MSKSLQLNLCLEVLPAVIMLKSWHQQSPSMPLSSFMVTWPHGSKHLAHQPFCFLPSGFGVFKAAKEKLQHPYLQSISKNMSIHQSGDSEIILQLIGNLSHHLQGFIHPRWLLRFSSINSMNHNFLYAVSRENFTNKLKSWGLERNRTIHLPIKKCMALATAMVQLHSTQFLLGFAQLPKMIKLIQLSTKRRLNRDVCVIWFKWKKIHRANSISNKKQTACTIGILNPSQEQWQVKVSTVFLAKKCIAIILVLTVTGLGGKHPNLYLSGGFNPTTKGKPTP